MSRDRLITILKGAAAPVTEDTEGAKRARLFRRLLMDHNVTEAKFNALLNDYITTVKKPKAKYEEMAMRGNLMRELARPEMTEKVLKRGLDLLKLPHNLADQAV